MTAEYCPSIFMQSNEEAAKRIILTPEGGLSTDERWELETEWMLPHLVFPDGLVVDYGSGVGRLSKRIKGPVLGVDLSPTMRVMAEYYVQRADFAAASPDMFRLMVRAGLRCVGGLSVWTLQHAMDPRRDIAALSEAIVPGGLLLVVNMAGRRVPATQDGKFLWLDDGVDVDGIIRETFEPISRTPVPEAVCGTPGSFLRLHRRRV